MPPPGGARCVGGETDVETNVKLGILDVNSRRLRVRAAILEDGQPHQAHEMGDMVDNKALKQKDVGMGIGY
jgi:hypothetical protein